jgi:hypothetical protein
MLHQGLGLGQILWHNLSKIKLTQGFGMQNVRRLYKCRFNENYALNQQLQKFLLEWKQEP